MYSQLRLDFTSDWGSAARASVGQGTQQRLAHQQLQETESGGAWIAVQMGFDGTFLFAKLGFKF